MLVRSGLIRGSNSFRSRRLFRRLGDNLDEPPSLGLGQAAGFHDLDLVAGPGLIVFVMDVANRTPPDVFAVAGVLDQPGNFHPARLVHFVAGYDADLDPTLAT